MQRSEWIFSRQGVVKDAGISCQGFAGTALGWSSNGLRDSKRLWNQPSLERDSPDEDEQEHDCDPDPGCCEDRESCTALWTKRATILASRFAVSANHGWILRPAGF